MCLALNLNGFKSVSVQLIDKLVYHACVIYKTDLYLKEYKVVLLLVFLICNIKQYALESMFSPLQGSPLSQVHP